MSQSILTSTKKNLGLDENYTAFDLDVMTHINTVFLSLYQLGVGPADGFMVNGPEETWDALLGGDPRLNAVKTYVYLKVRLAFDPPGTSFAITSMEKQIAELEWRINVLREEEIYTPPVDVPLDESDYVLDGGAP